MDAIIELIQKPVDYIFSIKGKVEPLFESNNVSSFKHDDVFRVLRCEDDVYDLSISVNAEPALWVQVCGNDVDAYIHFSDGSYLIVKGDYKTKQYLIDCDDLMYYYLIHGKPIFKDYMMI